MQLPVLEQHPLVRHPSVDFLQTGEGLRRHDQVGPPEFDGDRPGGERRLGLQLHRQTGEELAQGGRGEAENPAPSRFVGRRGPEPQRTVQKQGVAGFQPGDGAQPLREIAPGEQKQRGLARGQEPRVPGALGSAELREPALDLLVFDVKHIEQLWRQVRGQGQRQQQALRRTGGLHLGEKLPVGRGRPEVRRRQQRLGGALEIGSKPHIDDGRQPVECGLQGGGEVGYRWGGFDFGLHIHSTRRGRGIHCGAGPGKVHGSSGRSTSHPRFSTCSRQCSSPVLSLPGRRR